jgi:signal transduction histidine kinase/ActR/RegA family two-component response regulator
MDLIKQLWNRTPLISKGIALIALPLILLITTLSLLYVREKNANTIDDSLNRELDTQQIFMMVETTSLEASIAVRDYLLTGDKKLLVIYSEAIQKIPKLMTDLTTNIQDDEQKKILAEIKALLMKNAQLLKALSEQPLDKAPEATTKLFQEQSDTLDSLFVKINLIKQLEIKLISADRAKVKQQREFSNQLALVAALLGSIGAAIGVLVFSSSIVKRIKVLHENASRLAKGETIELPNSSQDEIGQLYNDLELSSNLLVASINDAHFARNEAEIANHAKTRFLSRTSHELRTPLNAILGFAQILEMDLENQKMQANATIIKNAGEHLLKLINEVLDIARIEAGDMPLNMSKVNVGLVLKEAADYIKPLGKVRDIDIKLDIADTVYVNADRQKLLQVVLNLLSNAYKYGPSNSVVTLSAKIVDQQCLIGVHDTGTGIPEAMRKRIFTPFDRLGAENTKIEGTGLGLTVSKQLIQSMGGEITLDTQQSLFLLSLPILTSPAAENSTEVARDPATVKTRIQKLSKIMYVEDNLSNIALIETLISRFHDLRLNVVKTLADARGQMEDIDPDLILIDLNLPDGNGEDFLKDLLRHPIFKSRPIVVMSADAAPETITRIMQLGATDYFTKPININAFIKGLKTWCTVKQRA